MEIWRNLTVKHLGRRILRHVESLRVDIVAVDVGVKPAYLFDIGQPVGEKLINLLQDLKQEKLIENNLNVIEIGMDCLIVNVEELKKSVNLVRLNETLVDVSKSLESPCFSCNSDVVANIKEVVHIMMDQIDSTRVKLSALSSSISCNISSLFGLMLNYPLIYWYEDHDGKGGNCLSMEKLISVKVTATYAVKSTLKFHSESKVDYHCLYSFSYPNCLNSACKLIVEQWFDQVKDKLHAQELFSDVKIAFEEVTLEAVSL